MPAAVVTRDTLVTRGRQDNTDFLKVLNELSDHFDGEEEKGDPLTDRLPCMASILTSSLRRRPTSEGVKMTCSKI
ncbi:hypothetical protein Pmani_020461 [Petrolisthes manimaculis]|uniref:Uncharacterized protein n=1 Tax=Petrolisthes manimaculis TaxID=1843537 RepID=A0AAE1PIN1_9EUCA|nr:hypothetical protein Pmani_020461 [Petrolisthes manimaculis]